MAQAAGRLGDKAHVPSDGHGCPACAHSCVGPANKDTVRSNHALGTAIDINAPENAYGTKGADRGAKGSVRELADFCADFGLYWGGWYSKNKDLMHFEAVKILEGAALRAACEKHGVVYEEVVEVIGDFPTPSGDTMMA